MKHKIVFLDLLVQIYQIKSRIDLFQTISSNVDPASSRVNILDLGVDGELLHAAIERFRQLKAK